MTVIDSTYGVVLPESYRHWMQAFSFVGKLDWAALTLPETCIFPLGFRQGMIMRAVAPLLLIAFILIIGQVLEVSWDTNSSILFSLIFPG